MAEPANEPEMGKGLTWIGGATSAVWLTLALIYVLINWADMALLKPNEVGDFLAGCFAPLAFFWLVLGFFQQGSELRNSGRALWLQGEELRNSVEQQRQLVDVTREQLQFESQRMAAELERQRRLAQPRLSLELGGWNATRGVRNQDFNLINYGRPCTQIEIGFSNDWSGNKQNHLGTGDRLPLQKQLKEWEGPVIATITYLDEQMEAGVARFQIDMEGELVWISEYLEPVSKSAPAAE